MRNSGRFNILFYLLLILVLNLPNGRAEVFLHTDGKKIVDGAGQEIILRGMGLGGWMLQEGYMMQTASFANAQFQLKAKIEELVGTENMEAFYTAWLDNFIQKEDIDSLAAWGFNAVRLPMHYNLYTLPIEEEPVAGTNTWLEKGFELTDSLLSWCAQNEIYVILDLHAAPGGQGYESGISDYDESKPSLWESAENRAKTVALWKKLASRYADEPWIGGYDLINETNWDLPGNSLLRVLYQEITNAIREVDQNHILFIEGNWFANDFTGLTPPWDDNMVYSFHKYWSYNNQSSIQWMLEIRNKYNVPLWCGESGENSNTWFRDAIRLLENNQIGWAWWPMKKIESISGPLSIPKNEGYQKLLDYWNGSGPNPGSDSGFNALLKLADNARIENCQYQKDVIDAMFRQVYTDDRKPFKDHRIPGTIFAADFDMGRNGFAYSDAVDADYHVSTGNYTSWNNGWAYRNDGVDLQACNDDVSIGYNVGWTEDNEWLAYTVHVERSDSYAVAIRVAADGVNGRVFLQVDGNTVTMVTDIPQTGGWQDWQTFTLENIFLSSGRHDLKLRIVEGGFNINYLQFTAQQIDTIEAHQDTVSFELLPCYPNPFNAKSHGQTIIPVRDPGTQPYQLDIFNILGACVRSNIPIIRNEQTESEAGVWDGLLESGVPASSGVYICRLKSRDHIIYQRIMLIR